MYHNQQFIKKELVELWKASGFKPQIIDAFLRIPREFFVAPNLFHYAYDDRPLPTIRGQSISQPTTVMLMTQALDIKEDHRILEVGAGVGYQASILSKLARKGEIITTEIIPELVDVAKKNTFQLGCSNVYVLETDGSRGVDEKAPFDRIIITAACPKIPEPIIEQTKDGGIIVAPIGTIDEQILVKATKIGARLELEFLGPFMFVPLQGKYGFERVNQF
ncbi:protein-L-isoaspartate(D-aspartate) O-methyltransferase [Candidatus Woesearchaeota archaeon]|nr:protein-L-isoaspartate(D-aspartate) O-methyltransferase [Candidatus Woesearchaeota archaeon]